MWSQYPAAPSRPEADAIRVVCISDTHSTHRDQPPIPCGDVLIHAGDLTDSGTSEELANALEWLTEQPHQYKVFVAGNHDAALADETAREELLESYPGLIYLQDTSVEITVRTRVLRVFGSPRTPKHGSWSFQYPRDHPSALDSQVEQTTEACRAWSLIPPATDILITHGPPFAHCDLGKSGCASLLSALWRIRPRLHVCGHIHGDRGMERLRWGHAQKAYEDVYTGKNGWAGLCSLVCWTATEQLRRLWTGSGADGTLLVNAAAVGGARDHERLGAIVVQV